MTDPITTALDRLQEYAAAHPEHDTDELVARARAELAEPAVPAASQTSDGYHTFEELYEHRHALFLALIKAAPVGCFTRSWKHNDGELCFGGDEWFIVSGQLPGASQISYHLPRRLWKIAGAAGANEVEQSGPWDGHTAVDVVDRLLGYAGLAEADGPAALPIDFIDPEHSGTNREMLEEFYAATFCEGGTDDVITLRGINAVLSRWGQPPAPPAGGEAADEPAVPEGREPVSVAEQPRPNPPAEGEVAELVAWLRENAENERWLSGNAEDERQMSRGDNPASLKLDRAAELLERHAAPVPMSVAERLPGPKDCDAEGRVWLWGKVGGDWRLINPANSGVPRLQYCFSHWLPASALPLPAPQGGEVEL